MAELYVQHASMAYAMKERRKGLAPSMDGR